MVIQDIKSTKEKHAPALRASSKAMRVRLFDAKCITQYGRSRATLDTTADQYLPRIAPADAMVIDVGAKNEVVALRNCFLKLAFKRHETDPLLSSSKQLAA